MRFIARTFPAFLSPTRSPRHAQPSAHTPASTDGGQVIGVRRLADR